MPRPSIPLNISQEDIARLNSLLPFANDVTKERIQIILTCAKEPSNKKVAQELGIDEHRVAKWKKAFQKDGVDCLQSAHSCGRKAKNEIDGLEELILCKLNESDKEWTIQSLAESLGCTAYQASVILKQHNISLARKRVWTYTTMDTLSSCDEAIIGLYLSCEISVVIVCAARYGIVSGPGVLETRSREFVERLNRSSLQVSLPNAIVEMSNYNLSDNTSVNFDAFLKRFAETMKDFNGLEYHMFIYSPDVYTFKQIVPARLAFDSFNDIEEWEYRMHSWLGSKARGVSLVEQEIVLEAIISFVKGRSEKKEPLCWMKRISQVGTKENRIPYEPYEESTGIDITADASLPLNGLLSTDGKVRSGFIAFVADDRKVSYKIVESDQIVDPKQFDFTSKNGFMNGLNHIEGPIIQLRDEAGIAAMDLCLENVKKN